MLKLDQPDIYKAILETLQIGVCVVDRDQRIVFWNEGAERISGFLKQEMLGRPHTGSVFAPSAERATTSTADPDLPILQVLRDGKRVVTDGSIQHKKGYQLPVRLSAAPIRNELGMIIGATECFDEGFASPERNRRDSLLALHGVLDDVTGIACTGFVESQLREHLTMFEYYPIPFSVLCIQIDGLENWKTTLGAGAVPIILRSVAQTMENCIRPGDLLGRWRDDRFLCILTECPESQIKSVARRLRSSINRDEIRWWGQKVAVTISLGGATAKPGDTCVSMLQRAEESLLESVKGGGNSFTVPA